MLKDYIGVPERTYNIDFSAMELHNETALIMSKIEQANKILEVIQNTEKLTIETAKALLLPIYDYDKEFMDNDLLTIESGFSDYSDERFERNLDKRTKDMKIDNVIKDIIKKFFRIFYNLFQKLYEKIILWVEGLEPFIKKLESKIENTTFGKPEDWTEDEKEKILNIIGVFALFNGKLEDNVIGRIITSFKNMKDFDKSISGYCDFINYVPTLVKNSEFVYSKVNKNIDDSFANKFVSKLPKFYKDISGQLKTCIENGTVNINGPLSRHIVKGQLVATEDLCIVSTNGNELNILYTVNTEENSPWEVITLKHAIGTLSNEKLIKDVSMSPLDKDRMIMLLNAVSNSKIKDISTSVRSSFKKLETDVNTAIQTMDKFELPDAFERHWNQLVRTVFSDNLSILNKTCFDYITYNAKLSGNCLKFIDMSLNKYSQTKEEEK